MMHRAATWMGRHWQGILRWGLVPLALAGAPNVASSAAPEGYTAGTPWVGSAAVRETVEQIMARGRLAPQAPTGVRERKPRMEMKRGRGALAGAGGSSAAVVPLAAGGVDALALPAQTVGTSFLGAQLSDSGFIPPDSMGDVGPSQILVCVNGRIRVFSRSGVVGALDASTDVFFGSVMVSGTSDPQVRYDRLSGRWFVSMIDVASFNNRVLLAVSSGPVITNQSSFSFYYFQQNTVSPAGDNKRFADYPSLGVDPNALYIGVNMFGGRTPTVTVFVIRKTSVLSGGPIVVTAFRNLGTLGASSGPWSPRGVDNDDPNATEGYFIGVDTLNFGVLTLRRILNPGGTPSISANLSINVPATGDPMMSFVPANGSLKALDNLDDRLYAARMRKGSLFTAHNFEVDATGTATTGGGRDGSRWYEIVNLTNTPSLRQSGTLYDPGNTNPTNYWIPSCAVSGQGHMALGCSVAGVNEHAEIAVAGRYAGDALGSLRPPVVAQGSSSAYNVQNTAPQRWGDYSVTGVDPNDDMTLWTFQEYCNAANSWGVRAIQLRAPPPALLLSCVPAVIHQGDTNLPVTVIGVATNGSGFFDPGAGFSNRLQAAIGGGGVTLNALTWLNPTSLVMTVSVAPLATPGGRTITVTNPDGQAATSAVTLLSVVSPVQLEVVSAHDNAVPPPGLHLYDPGATVTALVTQAVLDGGTTQIVCAGWIGSGSVPATGNGTNTGPMILTNDSVITWQWTTNYLLTVTAGVHGAVSPTGGWFAANTNLPVTAAADPYYQLAAWTGDTNGCTITPTQLVAAMTRPRAVGAGFTAILAAQGTPQWWLAFYGLTNTSFDVQELLDTDHDRMPAWQEYVAGTDPTNPLSYLGMALPVQSATGSVVRWTSVSNHTYELDRASNLVVGFDAILETNLAAMPPLNTYTDSATGGFTSLFYRVLVHPVP